MKKYFIILAIISIFSALRAEESVTESVDNSQPQQPVNVDTAVHQQTLPVAQEQPQSTENATITAEQQPTQSATGQTEQTSTTEEPQSATQTTTTLAENADENLTPEEQKIKSLLRKNPFAEPGSVVENGMFGNTQSPATAPDGLELRGITCIDGKWKFYIYDASMKMSYRIGLRQPQNDMSPYTIDFYDEETNSVSISNAFGTYTLTLKTPDAPKNAPAVKKQAPAKVKVTKNRR